MPFFDGTGPLGYGPMTGRGLGPCGYGLRRSWGYGRGLGYGRGFGRRSYNPWLDDRYLYREPSQKEEAEMLKEDAEILTEELEAIKAKLKELKETK